MRTFVSRAFTQLAFDSFIAIFRMLAEFLFEATYTVSYDYNTPILNDRGLKCVFFELVIDNYC